MLDLVSDDELLERLLGRRLKGIGLARLLDLDQVALRGLGLSSPEAVQIATVAEIARRHQPPLHHGDTVTQPRQAVSRLWTLRTSTKARMVVLLLDRSLRFKAAVSVGESPEQCARASPEALPGLARAQGAAAVILAHNHVDQDVVPTDADIEFTRQVLVASERSGVELADHLIVAARGWFSCREARLLH